MRRDWGLGVGALFGECIAICNQRLVGSGLGGKEREMVGYARMGWQGWGWCVSVRCCGVERLGKGGKGERGGGEICAVF